MIDDDLEPIDDAEAFRRLAQFNIRDPQLRRWLGRLQLASWTASVAPRRFAQAGEQGRYVVGPADAPTLWQHASAGAGALSVLALNVDRWISLGPAPGASREPRGLIVCGRWVDLTPAARSRRAWWASIDGAVRALAQVDPVLAGLLRPQAERGARGVHLRQRGDGVEGLLRLPTGQQLQVSA